MHIRRSFRSSKSEGLGERFRVRTFCPVDMVLVKRNKIGLLELTRKLVSKNWS